MHKVELTFVVRERKAHMDKSKYSLTVEEEATCVEVGYQRQKPYFGDPTKNINYSEGDLWETWQHVVCAGSELAFARLRASLNSKFSISITISTELPPLPQV